MKLIFTLAIVSAALLCRAQQNTYLLKYNGKYVDKIDSADYIRIVKLPDTGSVLYNVSEYYKSGKIKSIGKSSQIDPPRYIGSCVTYFESGKRQSLYEYAVNGKIGNGYEFYPNGKLYRQVKYPDDVSNKDHFADDYLIIANLDSLGNPQVSDGQGYYNGFNTKFGYIDEEGPVKNGRRDSTWAGNDKNLKLTFTETYQNGALVTGTTVDSAGVKFAYKGSRQTSPQFAGGDEAFGRYLANNIIYPDYERQNNIQGTVVLYFVVEKDGKLKDIKVQKSVSRGLDNEATRVIKRSPTWLPGTRFGKPVRVSFAVPVSFALR